MVGISGLARRDFIDADHTLACLADLDKFPAEVFVAAGAGFVVSFQLAPVGEEGGFKRLHWEDLLCV